MIAYIMIFVHNDRLRTVNDDIQNVKIDINSVIVYIILYGIIFHEYRYICISVEMEPSYALKLSRFVSV